MSHGRHRIIPPVKNSKGHTDTHRYTHPHTFHSGAVLLHINGLLWASKYNMMNFPWHMKLVLLLWAICITQTNPLERIPSCLLSSSHRYKHAATPPIKDDGEYSSRWALYEVFTLVKVHKASLKNKKSFFRLLCACTHSQAHAHTCTHMVKVD